MVSNWLSGLSALELIGFLAFALSIVTAAPEEAFSRAGRAPDGETTRRLRLS